MDRSVVAPQHRSAQHRRTPTGARMTMATTPETTAETAIRPDKAARDMTADEIKAWREAHPWVWRAHSTSASRTHGEGPIPHDHDEFCFARLLDNLAGLTGHRLREIRYVEFGRNGNPGTSFAIWSGFIDGARLCAEISGFEERHRAMDFAVAMHLARIGKSWDETGADPEQFASCNVFAKAVAQIRAATRRV